MATAHVYLCSLCEADDISNEAVRWCLECQEWLCTDCNKHHGRSKLSKQHKTITVNEYNNLPHEVLTISNKCTQHSEKLDFFCSSHEVPCCIRCVSNNHKECTCRPIGEVLENIKTSAAISNLEEDLKVITENFETITKHLVDREVDVTEQQAQCLQEVHQLRKRLNDHLDAIEKRLTDELLSEQKKLQTKYTALTNQVKSRKDIIGNVLKELPKIKQYATELQLFFSMKKIEKENSEQTSFVQNLLSDDCKEYKSLRVKFTPALESLINDVQSFGKVVIDTQPSTLKIKTTRQAQAQMIVPSVAPIDLIKVKQMYAMHLSFLQIIGCAVLPDGRSMFTDFSAKCLRICNSDGVYLKDVDRKITPNDMCLINDNLAALSCYHSKEIVYIDLKEFQIKNRVYVESRPSGIASDGNQIIYVCPDMKTIQFTDLDGNITNRIKTNCSNLVRVAVWENNILCTDWKANKVLCYDTKGKLVWTYKNETIQKPFGIAVDKRGFVYVALEMSNKLLVISPDGSKSKILLDENDGLKEVNCISIYKDRLLLCNRYSGLAMYSLSQ